MKQLLNIEWLKIKNYTAFKLLGIFFIAGVLLTNYVAFYVTHLNTSMAGGAEILVSSFKPYGFSQTWQTTSYLSSWLLMLPAMLLVMLLTNEYSYKTHRQNIIDGWSRYNFISVKIVTALIFAVVSSVLVIFVAILFGLFSKTSFSLEGFQNVGFFFLKALTYNLFAILVSVLVKRTGFAIGLFFVYVGAENLISLFLDAYSAKLKVTDKINVGNMGSYLPLNASDSMLSFPDNPVKSMVGSAMPQDIWWVLLILAIAYIALMAKWSVHKFQHADL
jgi:ABC-2 type transport system permease protein